MRLTEFLSQTVIKVPLAGSDKKAILRELVDIVFRDEAPSCADNALRSVLERERLMSSGIGQGIALPHGFSSGGVSFAAALGIAAEPVDFDAIDGKPVTLVFLLISDEEHTTAKLKALARISRLLHCEQFRTALAGCPSAADAMQVIVDEEARHRI